MRKGLFFTIIFLILIAMGLSYYVLFMNDKEITITFNTNSEIKTNSLVIKKGDSIKLPTLERDGYIFLGWYIGEEKIDSSYKFDKTSFVNARWEPNSTKDKVYTVKFVKRIVCPNCQNGTADANCIGGSCEEELYLTKEVKDGEKVEKPTNPTIDGQTFIEWQLDGKTYDFNTPVTADLTLNAKWMKNDNAIYTITLINEHGSPSRVIKLKYTCGTIISGLPVLQNVEQKEFIGWFDNNKLYKNGEIMPCKDITLYAKWSYGQGQAGKPIIYLYPEKKMDIIVKLGNLKDVTTIYPKYNNGWNVTAYPDGKLIDKNTGRSLYSLYWEGKNFPIKDVTEGFVVKGEDTIDFLEEKLEILGLNEREAEEFIIYWLPQMEHNKYNFIRFEDKNEIDKYMPLEITPKPDTVIRILMEFKPLDKKIEVKEQKLTKIERIGYTAVEWGGSIIHENILR